MTTTTASATARQFGRCPERGCKTRLVLDPATDSRVIVKQLDGKTVAVKVDAPARTDLGHNVIVGGGGDTYCATKHGAGAVGAHHVAIKWQGVKGTFNHMECDSRCWSATAADCKCSCGGANHGMDA